MSLVAGVALVALLGIVLYAIFGGADFGGGVWDLLATGPRSAAQRAAISEAIGPVWEANHVWLIFVLVTLWTCFPPAFADIATGLNTPLAIALLGIVLRGSAFAFRNYAADEPRIARPWTIVFGSASTIAPFFFGAAAGGIATGRYDWTSPFALCVGVFAVALCAQLAAVFLLLESEDPALRRDFHRRMDPGRCTRPAGGEELSGAVRRYAFDRGPHRHRRHSRARHRRHGVRRIALLPGRAHRGRNRGRRGPRRLVRCAGAGTRPGPFDALVGRLARRDARRIPGRGRLRRRHPHPVALLSLLGVQRPDTKIGQAKALQAVHGDAPREVPVERAMMPSDRNFLTGRCVSRARGRFIVKHWLQTVSIICALAFCATSALAQTPSPGPSASPGPGRFQAMRQMRQQMRQIETQARTQMLNALTPAHRTLLSNVVGQLAVSPTPDFRAAAQQLDSALSAGEKQSILNAETTARSQMRNAIAQMRSQSGRPGALPSPQATPQLDAGVILLRHALAVGRGPRPM